MGSCDIWDLLHDATVVAISGAPPGTLRLEVECDYLRDRIADPGTRFFLVLDTCTRFRFRPWSDEAIAIEDVVTIASRRLWILSAQHRDGACIVKCSEHTPHGVGGDLEVAAAAMTLIVESGREVTIAELEDVAEEYWSGFNANKNR